MAETVLANFRLTAECREQLARLAERLGYSQRVVIELAVAEFARKKLSGKSAKNPEKRA